MNPDYIYIIFIAYFVVLRGVNIAYNVEPLEPKMIIFVADKPINIIYNDDMSIDFHYSDGTIKKGWPMGYPKDNVFFKSKIIAVEVDAPTNSSYVKTLSISTQTILENNFNILSLVEKAKQANMAIFDAIVNDIKQQGEDKVSYGDLPKIVYDAIIKQDTLKAWSQPKSVDELMDPNNMAMMMMYINFAVMKEQNPDINLEILRHINTQIALFNSVHVNNRDVKDLITNSLAYRDQYITNVI